ncbi:MAG: dethiobiotin synthase [Aquificae bacterium]|nr:dethiobiotin synthase [Aquificota bacterium]
MRVLITGTDTGVGKTFITYNLAKGLRERGFRVACFKPVETGVRNTPEDGSLLARATGQEVNQVVPVRFGLPLAPYSATLEEGRDFSLEELKEIFLELAEGYDVVLVEGAGGIAVPLKRGYTFAHLARDWGLGVFIVGRAGLGTINHTFLTWHYARSLSLRVGGIVLNRKTGRDVSERTNPRVVEEMTGIKPFVVPEVEPPELEKGIREELCDYFLSGFKP